MPWQPVRLTIEAIHSAGAALTFAGLILVVASAGWFVLGRTTLNPAGQPARLIVTGAHAWWS
jgi:hypothetical protein